MDRPPRLIASPADLADTWPDLRATSVVALDLRSERLDWSEARLDGATFFGCLFPAGVPDRLSSAGAAQFSLLRDLPFEPYRTDLYGYEELASGHERGVPQTLDVRISSWFASSSTSSLPDLAVRA